MFRLNFTTPLREEWRPARVKKLDHALLYGRIIEARKYRQQWKFNPERTEEVLCLEKSATESSC